ncbi:MAG: class I SAM-dependent methyltransferase [Flammeovirgaceae bacterium]
MIRPEPQAIWEPALSEDEWQHLAHAHFTREQKENYRFGEDIKGGWKKLKTIPDSWNVIYKYNKLSIKLRLSLTNFGHVGIFPEQGENWNFIYDTITSWAMPQPKVLNLFAYSGAASVVAKAAGADVMHVDASRPGLNWANENMKQNNLDNIRWVHEDALKFVKREAKRGKKYNGIIMDPPPYGRGPEGEKWSLEDKLNELVALSSELLEKEKSFFILSMYAVGLSSMVGLNVVKTHFKNTNVECGEFFLKSKEENNLPMGTFVRFNH